MIISLFVSVAVVAAIGGAALRFCWLAHKELNELEKVIERLARVQKQRALV